MDVSLFYFENQKQMAEAQLGQPVPVYRFDMALLLEGSNSLVETMVDTGKVEFSVEHGGRMVTRLRMSPDGNTYTFDRFGGSGSDLARGLSSLPRQAVEVRLVMLGPAEFLYAQVGREEFLVSMNPMDLGDMKRMKPYRAAEALPLIQQAVNYVFGGRLSDSDDGYYAQQEVGTKGSMPSVSLTGMSVGGVVGAGLALRIRRKGRGK